MLSVPVNCPIVAMSIKTFVPIMLIVVCAGLIFFVRPRYIEGRIGLGITALLTLVALQLATGGSLPDVDYLMMLDKIYLLAYLFIIIALGRVVATSWLGDDASAEKSISRKDRIFAVALLVGVFRRQYRNRLGYAGLNFALHQDPSSPNLRDRDGRRGQPAFLCVSAKQRIGPFGSPAAICDLTEGKLRS